MVHVAVTTMGIIAETAVMEEIPFSMLRETRNLEIHFLPPTIQEILLRIQEVVKEIMPTKTAPIRLDQEIHIRIQEATKAIRELYHQDKTLTLEIILNLEVQPLETTASQEVLHQEVTVLQVPEDTPALEVLVLQVVAAMVAVVPAAAEDNIQFPKSALFKTWDFYCTIEKIKS